MLAIIKWFEYNCDARPLGADRIEIGKIWTEFKNGECLCPKCSKPASYQIYTGDDSVSGYAEYCFECNECYITTDLQTHYGWGGNEGDTFPEEVFYILSK